MEMSKFKSRREALEFYKEGIDLLYRYRTNINTDITTSYEEYENPCQAPEIINFNWSDALKFLNDVWLDEYWLDK